MEQESHPEEITNTPVMYAGFWRRFLAFHVDFLITFSIGLVFQTALGKSPFSMFSNIKSLNELQQMQNQTSTTIVSLISIIVGFAYYLMFYVNYDGATPGKRLMAIKVTKDDGSKVTYPVVFVRYLGTFLSAMTLGLGYFWIGFDKRKQAFHDKIAKTLVVKTEEKPKTFLAIIITLFTIIFFSIYMGSFMYLGVKLAEKETKSGKVGANVSASLKQNKENMLPAAKAYYDESQELFKQLQAVSGDPEAIKPIADQVIAVAKLATDTDPSNPILWSNLGDAYSWSNTVGTMEDGLNAFKKAEALDPTNLLYINYVGDQLIKMGRNGEAVLQFQKTFRIGKDNSGFAHLSAGTAYKNLGVYDEARKQFERAIEIFQNENEDGKFDARILEAQKGISSLPK